MRVVGRIVQQALATPEKIAAAQNGRPVSYRWLAAAVWLARRLLEQQAIGSGELVVVCINNLLAGWIARLALSSLGAITVSVRSGEDVSRLGVRVTAIVTDPAEAAAWPNLAEIAAAGSHRLVALPLDAYQAWEAVDLRMAAPTMAAGPGGGHILLTSGTTGIYKKVLYDGVFEAELLARNLGHAGVGPDSIVAVFNFAGWTMANYLWSSMPWSAGGEARFHQGREPWALLADPSLTHVVITPQMLTEVLAAPTDVSLRNDRLKMFMVGGVMSASVWRAASERIGGEFWSIYGSTECANLTFTRIESPDDLYTQRIHAPDRFQVVDDDDQPLPMGRQGRVRLQTTGVDGYLNDEETSRAFFRGGYFYPGDLGVLREDGRLMLQGRITDVINVMGAKIATLPIETMLQDRCGLEAVCVFSAPTVDGEIVHVAVQSRAPIDEAAIQAAMNSAIPRAGTVRIHRVASMPRNAMGKIERATLKTSLLA